MRCSGDPEGGLIITRGGRRTTGTCREDLRRQAWSDDRGTLVCFWLLGHAGLRCTPEAYRSRLRPEGQASQNFQNSIRFADSTPTQIAVPLPRSSLFLAMSRLFRSGCTRRGVRTRWVRDCGVAIRRGEGHCICPNEHGRQMEGTGGANNRLCDDWVGGGVGVKVGD